MSLPQLVDRLLTKRCVSFMGTNDKYQLITGEQDFSGFTEIGTENEKDPLILESCLSYDEIKLGALLSVSSHSEFINNGSRGNRGIVETDKSKIEREGVIIGIIGARFERPGFMEFQDAIITDTQNTIENGYGYNSADRLNAKQALRKIWDDFYANQSPLFGQVQKDGRRYVESKNQANIFDNDVMKKRYSISFDTLLLESEARASKAGRKGYIHVVGIGLGVWRETAEQDAIFLEAFQERVFALMPKLQNISWIQFSWFKLNEWGELRNGSVLKSTEHLNGIRIIFSDRDPAEKLSVNEFENCLVIVSYACNGNGLPGNEFWLGCLASTGDPAAACSTLITELHNPHINNTMVSGANLRIASASRGVVHVSDYIEQIWLDDANLT